MAVTFLETRLGLQDKTWPSLRRPAHPPRGDRILGMDRFATTDPSAERLRVH